MTPLTPGSSGGGSSKTCRKCGETKPLTDYHASAKSPDGRRNQCKTCVKVSFQARYRRDPARVKASQAKWRDKNVALILWHGARRRALQSNTPFSITPDDILIPETCPVFRQTLIRGHPDFAPSLDRLIPSLGYTPGNVVVVSWRANRLKNNASLTDLRALVDFYELVLPSPRRWQRNPS